MYERMILTGHFQCCIQTFHLADFVSCKTVVRSRIALITFFSNDVKEYDLVVQHHPIGSGMHFFVIFVPKNGGVYLYIKRCMLNTTINRRFQSVIYETNIPFNLGWRVSICFAF